MCPDPALLAAYLDRTLFSRDVGGIEQHVSSCARCAALLAGMQQDRTPRGSRPPRAWAAGAALAVVSITGIGAWAALPRSTTPTPQDAAPATSVQGPIESTAGAAVPAAPAETFREQLPVPQPAPGAIAPPEPGTDSADVPAGNADIATAGPAPANPARRQATAREASRAGRAAVSIPEAAAAEAEGTPEPAHEGSDLVLRGRRADRRVLWRFRDRVIEHSTDGGATWVAEHTSDRRVHAGAVVNSQVAWLVGENSLILRRTSNGWFGATPPAAGTFTAVEASSPSQATVTLDDGRVFSTENGGVTWSER